MFEYITPDTGRVSFKTSDAKLHLLSQRDTMRLMTEHAKTERDVKNIQKPQLRFCQTMQPKIRKDSAPTYNCWSMSRKFNAITPPQPQQSLFAAHASPLLPQPTLSSFKLND
jgi:hypothetical protein